MLATGLSSCHELDPKADHVIIQKNGITQYEGYVENAHKLLPASKTRGSLVVKFFNEVQTDTFAMQRGYRYKLTLDALDRNSAMAIECGTETPQNNLKN